MAPRRSARLASSKNIAAGNDSPKPSTKKVVLKSILKSRATSTTPSADEGATGQPSSLRARNLGQLQTAQSGFAAQSLELMKIALHVTIATLFFARGLLPAACFAEGRIQNPRSGPKPKIFSYEQFIEKDLSPKEAEKLPFPGAFLKIKKGVDRKADGILHNMEDGIFDALAKFRVRAIQFDVLEDKDNLQQVLESYTITTSYMGWQGGANRMYRLVSSVTIDDPKDNLKSLVETKKSIGGIVRSMLTLSSSFPKLPRERAIAMKIHFMPVSPEDYKPAGFENSPGDPISFPVCDGWVKVTRGCGEFNTGYHAASLNVSYMRCRSGEGTGSAAKRALALLLLSQQDLPSLKTFGESVRPGADIKLPQSELVSSESDAENSGDDTPTAALAPEGAVGTDGPPIRYQSCEERNARLGVRRRFFREQIRRNHPVVFTKKADAVASMTKAQMKAGVRAQWLKGEVESDYPSKLDKRGFEETQDPQDPGLVP